LPPRIRTPNPNLFQEEGSPENPPNLCGLNKWEPFRVKSKRKVRTCVPIPASITPKEVKHLRDPVPEKE